MGGRELLALLDNIQAGNVTFLTAVNNASEEAETEEAIEKDVRSKKHSSIKVPKEMRVSVLYTEDHVFIKEETRIGGNQDEWFPKSIVNVPESITTTE